MDTVKTLHLQTQNCAVIEKGCFCICETGSGVLLLTYKQTHKMNKTNLSFVMTAWNIYALSIKVR